jgi:hypothetical protein
MNSSVMFTGCYLIKAEAATQGWAVRKACPAALPVFEP